MGMTALTRSSTTSLVVALAILSAACQESKPDIPQRPDIPPRKISEHKPGDPVTNPLATARNLPSTLMAKGGPAERAQAQPSTSGPPVAAAAFPWQVALFLDLSGTGKGFRCGGILISPDYILTAAHCVDAIGVFDAGGTQTRDIGRIQARFVEVYYGHETYGLGRLATVTAVDIHPKWKMNFATPYAYDVALLKLSAPIVGMTPAPIQRGQIPSGNAVVSGWGRFDTTNQPSDVLRAVALPLVDNETRKNHVASDYKNYVHEASLCTESMKDDACKGDSGGPLVVGSRQRPQTVGVVSWGPDARCLVRGSNGGLIGGYTKGPMIAPWVVEKTADLRTVTDSRPEPLMSVVPFRRGGIDR